MSIVKLPVLSISSFSRRAFSNKRSLKGKTASSARWCQRQDRDPYVLQARREGLRSRAAFKLREINEVSLGSFPVPTIWTLTSQYL